MNVLSKGLIQTIKTYIEKNRLLPSDKPVIVGFSGGSDSVLLLYLLNRFGYQCIAAHCNFHLRDGESDRDELFCKKFTEDLHIVFEKADFDTRSYAAIHAISIEMAARELRYTWFETLRTRHDAQAIAVAHHRDDSNETLLLNLIRGTGIRGLSGIRPHNEWVVRPLLCIGKNEIIRYLTDHQLPFVTDSSNLSDEYTRNVIRLRLIPIMQELNPSIDEALARTAAHLSDVETIYLQTIEQAKEMLLKKDKDGLFSISIPELLSFTAPTAILYELLQPFGFTRVQSENVFNSLSGESGKLFETRDSRYQLLKDRTSLFIYQKTEKREELFYINENDVEFDNLQIRLSFRKIAINQPFAIDKSPSKNATNQPFAIDKSPSTATLDYEKISFPLHLRRWRTGDWFIPFGMKSRKKVSDFFSDHKYSILRKNKTWLLCSGNDVIWIVGERMDNRFRVQKNTKNVLVINFFSKNNCL